MRPTDDTIVAVGSPPGRSARAMIRITGPDAKSILDKLLTGKSQSTKVVGGWDAMPRRLYRCRVDLARAGSFAELPAMCLFLGAPHTATTQNMAEIQCPGNPALLERLLHRLIDLGARLAEPGEFLFRSFLVGKLDLTQAEGVAAAIAATSDSQLHAARLLRQGSLGNIARELVDNLAQQLALIEAGIDFVDQEDVVPITPADLDAHLQQAERRLDELLLRSRSWGALEALPRVVLAGPPSSGKSALFNALLGRHRAVSSPLPGTTRDILAEPLELVAPEGRRIEVMLVDIAGLDDPASSLDREIQAAVHDALARADLILHTEDGCHGDGTEAKLPVNIPIVRVRTKVDVSGNGQGDCDIAVSALTGENLAKLRATIVERVCDRAVSVSAQTLALQPRHESALRQALHHLRAARGLLEEQGGTTFIDRVELVAVACRAALDELACLGGRMTPDDIIGRVFATFCVGK